MVPSELLQSRLRRRYELGRLVRALPYAVPAALLTLVAARFGGDAPRAWVLGAIVAAVAVFLAWRGRAAGRAVLPGLLAGAIPLACALFARTSLHVCAGGECFSLCVPMCFLGGGVAGWLLSRLARPRDAGTATWAYGGGLAILTGSIGCACAGAGGIVGLLLGLAVVGVPAGLVAARARA